MQPKLVAVLIVQRVAATTDASYERAFGPAREE